MLQQLVAILIIALIVIRLILLRKKNEIGGSEFVLWLVFWVVAALFITTIKWLDKLVLSIGFSSSGIEVLLYLSIVILFYFNFRLRLKLEKMNKNITKIVRKISLDEIESRDKTPE